MLREDRTEKIKCRGCKFVTAHPIGITTDYWCSKYNKRLRDDFVIYSNLYKPEWCEGE